MSATWSLTSATLHQLASPATKQKSLLFFTLACLQNAVMADNNNNSVPVYSVPHGGDLSPSFMIMIVLVSILGLVFFGGCIAGVAILISRSRGGGDSSSSSAPEIVVVN